MQASDDGQYECQVKSQCWHSLMPKMYNCIHEEWIHDCCVFTPCALAPLNYNLSQIKINIININNIPINKTSKKSKWIPQININIINFNNIPINKNKKQNQIKFLRSTRWRRQATGLIWRSFSPRWVKMITIINVGRSLNWVQESLLVTIDLLNSEFNS